MTNQALAEVQTGSTELLPMSPREVVAQVAAIQELMKTVMQDGTHYGLIPGCGPKPTLLKAGAEKLAFMFRLAPLYEVTPTDLDNGHFRYEIKCALKSLLTGHIIAEGVGCCSSKETKYAYVRNEARPNLEDVRNTVEKMAAKRALVAAVLNGTAASDIFTQDVEDLPEAAVSESAETPAKPVMQAPQRKSQAPAPANGDDWRKMTSKFESKCSGGCNEMIKAGNTIYYSPKQKAAMCEACYEAVTTLTR